MKEAVLAIQTDEAFQLESEFTCAALKTSQTLEAWRKMCPVNEEKLSKSAHILVVRLQACFVCKKKDMTSRKERMWRSYIRLRTARTFVKDWKDFITDSVAMKTYLSFYQYITQNIFERLIKLEFPVHSFDRGLETQEALQPISDVEQCVLRYIAGYIIRRVHEKIQSMPHQYQKEMLNLLQSFAGREVNDIDTERWILMINRGGLWQVNNQTYGFFVRLETEIRITTY